MGGKFKDDTKVLILRKHKNEIAIYRGAKDEVREKVGRDDLA